MTTKQVDAYIAAQTVWQRRHLEVFRKAVRRVVPGVEEGWKWDVPVFLSSGRLVCAMSSFAKHTKYNFFEGATLADPHGLFNSGLASKRSRSINLVEGEVVDAGHLDELISTAFTTAAGSST